jgi:hypothetical protein
MVGRVRGRVDRSRSSGLLDEDRLHATGLMLPEPLPERALVDAKLTGHRTEGLAAERSPPSVAGDLRLLIWCP